MLRQRTHAAAVLEAELRAPHRPQQQTQAGHIGRGNALHYVENKLNNNSYLSPAAELPYLQCLPLSADLLPLLPVARDVVRMRRRRMTECSYATHNGTRELYAHVERYPSPK